MPVSQIIKDIRCLKKLIKNATGLKVYEQEAIYHHDSYWSISNEYKDKNSPHITVTRGSYWTLDDGAEYKISIYAPLYRLAYVEILTLHYFNLILIE